MPGNAALAAGKHASVPACATVTLDLYLKNKLRAAALGGSPLILIAEKRKLFFSFLSYLKNSQLAPISWHLACGLGEY